MFDDLGHNARWLALSYLLWGVGEGLWLYVQPLYAAQLGADPAQIGAVMGVMALVRVFANLPAGWLADRFGPRGVMLPGWLIGALGVFGIALAPDWRWLLPAYALYGLSGCAVPVSIVYMNRVVHLEQATNPRQTFSRVVTTLFAAYAAGQIVSPAVGGGLGEALGLRAVFVISAGWFALSTAAVLRTRPVPPPERQPGPGYSGLFRQRWLALAFVLIAVIFTATAMIAPTTGLTSKFMEEVRGLALGANGLLGSVNALGIVLLNLTLGRDARPMRALLAALALVWLTASLFMFGSSALLIGLGYLIGGSALVVRPLLQSIIAPHVRADQRGLVLASLESINALGGAAGAGVAGQLYAGVSPYAPFEAVLLVLPAAAALCWLALRVPSRVREPVGQPP